MKAFANTLAYYDTATITTVKSFIVQVPGSEFLGSIFRQTHKNKMVEFEIKAKNGGTWKELTFATMREREKVERETLLFRQLQPGLNKLECLSLEKAFSA